VRATSQSLYAPGITSVSVSCVRLLSTPNFFFSHTCILYRWPHLNNSLTIDSETPRSCTTPSTTRDQQARNSRQYTSTQPPHRRQIATATAVLAKATVQRINPNMRTTSTVPVMQKNKNRPFMHSNIRLPISRCKPVVVKPLARATSGGKAAAMCPPIVVVVVFQGVLPRLNAPSWWLVVVVDGWLVVGRWWWWCTPPHRGKPRAGRLASLTNHSPPSAPARTPHHPLTQSFIHLPVISL